mgnify:CR=1 FL=1
MHELKLSASPAPSAEALARTGLRNAIDHPFMDPLITADPVGRDARASDPCRDARQLCCWCACGIAPRAGALRPFGGARGAGAGAGAGAPRPFGGAR